MPSPGHFPLQQHIFDLLFPYFLFPHTRSISVRMPYSISYILHNTVIINFFLLSVQFFIGELCKFYYIKRKRASPLPLIYSLCQHVHRCPFNYQPILVSFNKPAKARHIFRIRLDTDTFCLLKYSVLQIIT